MSHDHTRSCGGKQAVWVHGRMLAKLATRQASAMYIATVDHGPWFAVGRLAARRCLPGIRSVCNCSCARSHAKSKKLGQKCIVMFLTAAAAAAAAAAVFSRCCLVEEHLLRWYWPVLRRWCLRIQGALGPPRGTQILI